MSDDAKRTPETLCRGFLNKTLKNLCRRCCWSKKKNGSEELVRPQVGDAVRAEELAHDLQSPRAGVKTGVAATQVHFVDSGETALAVSEIDAKCCVLEDRVLSQEKKQASEIESVRTYTEQVTTEHRQSCDQQRKQIEDLHLNAKELSLRLDKIELAKQFTTVEKEDEWVRCSVHAESRVRDGSDGDDDVVE